MLVAAAIGAVGAIAVAMLVVVARRQETTSIQHVFESSSTEHARALQHEVADSVNSE